MSDSWIDRLAKSVASRDLNQSGPTPTEEPIPLSRRSLLGRAGAATAGALAYLIPGMSPAHAAGCSGSKKKCNGRCVNTRTSERHCGACNHRCDNGEVCSRGKCCKKGTTNCNGKCVDLKRNEDNCGRCGRECGNNEVCSKGKCCPQGQKNCGGTCVSTQTDEQNCGTCGNSCSGDDVCVSGTCAPATCTDGIKNHGETDIDCGGPNCPGCQAGGDCLQGSDCQSGVCNGGTCQAAACDDTVKNGDETDVDCGGSCINNCANGKNCLAGSDCQSGVCTGGICLAPVCNDVVKNGDETDVDCGGGTCPDCANGKTCNNGTDCASGTCCGNVCRNTQTDLANCGNCGVVCSSVNNGNGSCLSGQCTIVCNAGFQDCDGQYGTGCETNTQADVNNCGNCGNSCNQVPNSQRTCQNGICGFTCNNGFANCNGNSVDGCEANTNTNPAHCGACNNACTGGDICQAGSCAPA